jgi:hypothetical protein
MMMLYQAQGRHREAEPLAIAALETNVTEEHNRLKGARATPVDAGAGYDRPGAGGGSRGAVARGRAELELWCSPVRRYAATTRLPGNVGANVLGPLVGREISARAKTKSSNHFLFVYEPELNAAVGAATGQPPVWQHREGPDTAAVREDHRLARAVLGPEFDAAVGIAAGQPPVQQHREGPGPAYGEVLEVRGLARTVRPERDVVILADAGQPCVRQNHEGQDPSRRTAAASSPSKHPTGAGCPQTTTECGVRPGTVRRR